jgi:hypothetical protein
MMNNIEIEGIMIAALLPLPDCFVNKQFHVLIFIFDQALNRFWLVLIQPGPPAQPTQWVCPDSELDSIQTFSRPEKSWGVQLNTPPTCTSNIHRGKLLCIPVA